MNENALAYWFYAATEAACQLDAVYTELLALYLQKGLTR